MQLRPLDLPAPVAPAMSRWGVVARLRNTAPPGDVLADRDVERVGGLTGLGSGQDVAERHELAGVVRYLDADGRPARDRRQDAHVGRRHGVGDVPLQRRDPGDLDPGPELELVPGDRRPDGHPDQLRLDAVAGQRLLQHPPTRLHLGRGRAPARCCGGGTTRAAASTGPAARPARGRSRAAAMPAPTRVVGSGGGSARRRRPRPVPTAPSSLAKSYEGGAVRSVDGVRPARCRGRGARRARQCRHAPHGLLRLPPGGTGATADASADPDRDPPERGSRRDQDPGDDHRHEQHDRPGRADELPERLTDDRAQPSAGTFHLRGRDDDLTGAAGHVQQAEHSQRGHADPDGQPPPMLSVAVHEQRDTASDEGRWQEEAADADQRAEPGVDPAPERPGEPEVDGQRHQRPDHDDDQADQVGPVRIERAADRGRPRPSWRRGAAAGGRTRRAARGRLGRAGPAGRALGRVAAGHGTYRSNGARERSGIDRSDRIPSSGAEPSRAPRRIFTRSHRTACERDRVVRPPSRRARSWAGASCAHSRTARPLAAPRARGSRRPAPPCRAPPPRPGPTRSQASSSRSSASGA